MSLWSDILTGSVGSVIKDVGGVVSDLVTTDKERLAAENEMEELGVRREEAYLGDRQDARRMQVEAVGRALAEWQGLQRQVTRQETQSLLLAHDRAKTALALYAAGGDLQPWLQARRDAKRLTFEGVAE